MEPKFASCLWGAKAPRRELQKLSYKGEKDVGRFPEWHVPGIGNHDLSREREEGDELSRDLDG